MDIFRECKPKFFAIVLFCLIMAEGCQSQPLDSQSQIAAVPTKPTTTSPLEPKPTTTKVVEIQPTATPKILPSPTSKSTQPSPDTVLPLSELILTWDDVYAWEDASGYYSHIRASFKDEVHYIIDQSQELDHRCPIECTKQVWYTEPVEDIGLDGKEFTYFQRTIIITMLSEDEDKAVSMAESMDAEFINYRVRTIFQRNYLHYFEKFTAPLENTRIGLAESLYGLPGYHIILTTSRGPIALLVISYIPPWVDDFTAELGLAVEFTNVQLFKLEQAGVVP